MTILYSCVFILKLIFMLSKFSILFDGGHNLALLCCAGEQLASGADGTNFQFSSYDKSVA